MGTVPTEAHQAIGLKAEEFHHTGLIRGQQGGREEFRHTHTRTHMPALHAPRLERCAQLTTPPPALTASKLRATLWGEAEPAPSEKGEHPGRSAVQRYLPARSSCLLGRRWSCPASLAWQTRLFHVQPSLTPNSAPLGLHFHAHFRVEKMGFAKA